MDSKLLKQLCQIVDPRRVETSKPITDSSYCRPVMIGVRQRNLFD